MNWVEDFLCLARLRSFSRAAEARCITQSAFSRRICSLENWLGAPLIDRSLHPVTLTVAGEDFLPAAADIARQIYGARSMSAQSRPSTERTITFAAQHSLSLDFFGRWMEKMEKRAGPLDIRLLADNYYTAVQSLRGEACDFLLCFTHPRIATTLRDLFEFRVLGRGRLVPVSVPVSGTRRPRFRLSGDGAANPTPYLSYGPHTFFDKVVRLILARRPCALDICFENAFSESLKSMALRGRGAAWLPESIVAADVAAGRLCLTGGAHWRERLDICLFRRRGNNTPLCDMLWKEAGRGDYSENA
ncbi:MAG: LysR family transcriptional regulator [Gammaproteobacteria bacterium]